jgi:hypothetical protein
MVRFLVGTRDFSRLYSVQTGSGAWSASYTVGTMALSPGLKRQWREADHSLHLVRGLKMVELYRKSPIRLNGARILPTFDGPWCILLLQICYCRYESVFPL